jgi:hypothetical protein
LSKEPHYLPSSRIGWQIGQLACFGFQRITGKNRIVINLKFAERDDMALKALEGISRRTARQNRLAEPDNVPQKAVE